MNAFSRKLLCGAVLAALPIGSALACTTGAWTNGEGSGFAGGVTTSTAGSPTPDGIARYSGECALEPADGAASFVLDNTPAAEGAASGGGGQPYRARFYVFAGDPVDTTAVFRATELDDGGGAERLAIDFDGAAFSFSVNGGAVVDSVAVSPNRWYSIEIFYQDGEASTATVVGAAGGVNEVAALGSPTGTIGSIQLGAIDGASSGSALKFDEFESTRSETTAIGRLCRGDGTGDGSVNIFDVSAIIGESVNAANLASGQPDCTEDGNVNIFDVSCTITLAVAATCGS